MDLQKRADIAFLISAILMAVAAISLVVSFIAWMGGH